MTTVTPNSKPPRADGSARLRTPTSPGRLFRQWLRPSGTQPGRLSSSPTTISAPSANE